jgi:HK97 family phage major capsid protein
MEGKMKLAELRHQRAIKVARLQALAKQEEELPEGDSMPDEALSEFQTLQNELADLAGRIARLEAVMAVDATSADDNEQEPIGNGSGDEASYGGVVVRDPTALPAEPGTAAFLGDMNRGGMRVYARPRSAPVEGRGFKAARFIIGVAHRKWHGDEKAAEFIYSRFKDLEVAKAVKALTYSVVAEGGALIPQDFMAELIELLRANTVVRGASPMTIGMPMGNITIPRLAGGATAGYQGEMDDITLTQEAFDDLNLSAKKLTAMVPVSNDLIRRAPIGVEEVVRDDLIQTIARREDLAFLRGDGSGKSPVGFRSLVLPANLINLPGAAGGATLDDVINGLSSMMLALINGMSRMLRPQWFMAPNQVRFIATRRDMVGGFYFKEEMSRGMLEGIPYSYTQQIPTNLSTGNQSEIYLVDMADAVIGDTLNVIVDASDVAAYYGTDGHVVSAFQRDQTLFRVISEHDFNMRHLQSLAIGLTPATGGGIWQGTGQARPGAPWSSQRLNPTWAQAPAAWPADATNPDPAPVLWTPAAAMTSALMGPLTNLPGGLPPGSIPPPPLAGDPPPAAPGDTHRRTPRTPE